MPKIILFCFSLFLIGGNFFRFLNLDVFPSNFSLVEFFLYALTLPLYFSKFRKSQLFIVAIIASTLYGIALNGLHLVSILYSFKLIGMIGGGVVVGEILLKKYPEKGLQFIIKIFTWNLALGAIIFLLFPTAHHLFLSLENYGIHFWGDPHVNRFISPFFDPNYYSAIACIPFLLTWHLRDEKPHYFILSILFLISIIASWSRSGIATCFFLIILMSIEKIPHLKMITLRPKRLLALPLLTSIFFLFPQELETIINRSINVFDDTSALLRWETFQMGANYFLDHPFFGVGYQFFSIRLQENFLQLNIDSSLLLTIITFGLLPTLAFVFIGLIWLFHHRKTPNPIFRSLYIYLVICILFTSQFNNLLYYQFWLMPIIAIFTYLTKGRNENSVRT